MKWPLQVLRAWSHLTQSELARAAKVNRNTILKIENGGPTRPATSAKILQAINRIRRNSGDPTIKTPAIGWEVVGDLKSRPFYQICADSGLTTAQVANRAGSPMSTVYKVAQGHSVLQETADTILTALNALRAERHLPPVSLKQIGVVISYDGGYKRAL